MKIKYLDKIENVEINPIGVTLIGRHVIALDGVIQAPAEEYVEPLIEDAVFEEVVTMANTIAEIKAYLDSMGTSYVGVTAKADLLALC